MLRPGEAQEVIEARKTSFVPGKKSAPGSRREDRAGSEVCHELVACWKLVLDIVLDIVLGLCTGINSSRVWTEHGVTYDLQSPSILSDHPKCKLGHWNIWEQLRYI